MDGLPQGTLEGVCDVLLLGELPGSLHYHCHCLQQLHPLKLGTLEARDNVDKHLQAWTKKEPTPPSGCLVNCHTEGAEVITQYAVLRNTTQ